MVSITELGWSCRKPRKNGIAQGEAELMNLSFLWVCVLRRISRVGSLGPGQREHSWYILSPSQGLKHPLRSLCCWFLQKKKNVFEGSSFLPMQLKLANKLRVSRGRQKGTYRAYNWFGNETTNLTLGECNHVTWEAGLPAGVGGGARRLLS